MKAVLISIHPEWVHKILNGEKTIEVRKTAPKIVTPFKCYIYCTKGGKEPLCYMDYCGYDMTDFREDFIANGKVVAEFICNRIEYFTTNYYTMDRPQTLRIARAARLGLHDLTEYEGNALYLCGWHISCLKIYDKPKALNEFYTFKKCNSCKVSGYESSACIYDEDCIVPAVVTRPPQSWCYVEELSNG